MPDGLCYGRHSNYGWYKFRVEDSRRTKTSNHTTFSDSLTKEFPPDKDYTTKDFSPIYLILPLNLCKW